MPSDRSMVGAILLAAGSSTRLGQPKQLLSWQGQSLLRHAATVALASGVSPLVVVLGSRADEIAPELDGLAVTPVINPDWEDGMGSSLQVGLRNLRETTDPEAVLVLLCDQPLVTPARLRTILQCHADAPRLAVASHYADGVLGPPCLFTRKLFPRLEALSGAQGARAVLGKLKNEGISRVPFPEGLMDVDTWEDWERVQTL